MVLRNWMLPRADGTTQFRIIVDTTPHTRDEFRKYKKKITRDDVTDEVRRKDNHLMDAVAYLGAYLDPLFDYGGAYYADPVAPSPETVKIQAFKALLNQGMAKRPDGVFYLGAGTPTAA
jgi:hypothetical protein